MRDYLAHTVIYQVLCAITWLTVIHQVLCMRDYLARTAIYQVLCVITWSHCDRQVLCVITWSHCDLSGFMYA